MRRVVRDKGMAEMSKDKRKEKRDVKRQEEKKN